MAASPKQWKGLIIPFACREEMLYNLYVGQNRQYKSLRQMTKEELLAYKEGHEAANRLEIQDLRSMSLDEKFKCAAALMESAREMGWVEALSAEDADARQLWIRLKRAYSGGG